ncbi:NAD(P)-binding protein [Altererythrobacter confluentis]|uniref:NAD(P)-binding protein n=1 Tax=Allopontixanthobacter confluentis TaxID=1849021 RepID=A0A6L7GIH4_9SPHN|nr:FAD-dependent monooxygenase [Allopontixanthobacter confluentis]MXP14491.1 NAD(P)-binding protein [Allopontixanthobacter confluentis]
MSTGAALAADSPLIIGAGPAGCMAAITLARAGAKPTLIDRDAVVGDALCGGFLSWRSAEQLRAIGIDLAELGAHRVERLALYAGDVTAEAALPATGFGLSRHALDTAMRRHAVSSGAKLEIDRIRTLSPQAALGERQEFHARSIFLAAGKHDVRGQARPRQADDPALGLRIRIPPQARLTRLLAGKIELHLFPGGYAGIVCQEDGSANVCLALRKSMLLAAGGNPRVLLDQLAAAHRHFGERLAFAAPDLGVDSIGAVPYGYVAKDTQAGLFRLGDQAAVIPSLAGEGMSIALTSGAMAARHWLDGGAGAATGYQRAMAQAARRPVAVAKLIWEAAESRTLAAPLVRMARLAPWLTNIAMRASRIAG